MEITALLSQVYQWARGRKDIVAVALVGSHARGAAGPDSDIDLIILCSEPTDYLGNHLWVNCFGQVAKAWVEDWGRVKSVRVHYDSGAEVEFGFSTPEWARVPIDPGTYEVARGGMRALHDPQGLLRVLQTIVRPSGRTKDGISEWNS